MSLTKSLLALLVTISVPGVLSYEKEPYEGHECDDPDYAEDYPVWCMYAPIHEGMENCVYNNYFDYYHYDCQDEYYYCDPDPSVDLYNQYDEEPVEYEMCTTTSTSSTSTTSTSTTTSTTLTSTTVEDEDEPEVQNSGGGDGLQYWEEGICPRKM